MTVPTHAFVPVRSQYLSRPVVYCSVCGHRDFWHDEGRCIGCAEPSGNYREVVGQIRLGPLTVRESPLLAPLVRPELGPTSGAHAERILRRQLDLLSEPQGSPTPSPGPATAPVLLVGLCKICGQIHELNGRLCP